MLVVFLSGERRTAMIAGSLCASTFTSWSEEKFNKYQKQQEEAADVLSLWGFTLYTGRGRWLPSGADVRTDFGRRSTKAAALGCYQYWQSVYAVRFKLL